MNRLVVKVAVSDRLLVGLNLKLAALVTTAPVQPTRTLLGPGWAVTV